MASNLNYAYNFVNGNELVRVTQYESEKNEIKNQMPYFDQQEEAPLFF